MARRSQRCAQPLGALSLFAFAGVLGVSTEALACSCMDGVSLEDSLEVSELVISGRIRNIEGEKEDPCDAESPSFQTMILVEVSSVWKGNAGETVVLRTGTSSASCGVERISIGDEAIFLATTWDDAGLRIVSCNPPLPLSRADDVTAILGEASPPDSTGREELPACESGCGASDGARSICLAGLMAFVKRRRGKGPG